MIYIRAFTHTIYSISSSSSRCVRYDICVYILRKFIHTELFVISVEHNVYVSFIIMLTLAYIYFFIIIYLWQGMAMHLSSFILLLGKSVRKNWQKLPVPVVVFPLKIHSHIYIKCNHYSLHSTSLWLTSS